VSDWQRTASGTWRAGDWWIARDGQLWRAYRDGDGSPDGGLGPFPTLRDARRAVDWVRAQGAEAERLRAALRDFAEYGTRADLNPTITRGMGGQRTDDDWHRYLARIDLLVRIRAKAALAGEGSLERLLREAGA
jgi:hypothetical protein